jgi:hypothetical protein
MNELQSFVFSILELQQMTANQIKNDSLLPEVEYTIYHFLSFGVHLLEHRH